MCRSCALNPQPLYSKNCPAVRKCLALPIKQVIHLSDGYVAIYCFAFAVTKPSTSQALRSPAERDPSAPDIYARIGGESGSKGLMPWNGNMADRTSAILQHPCRQIVMSYNKFGQIQD